MAQNAAAPEGVLLKLAAEHEPLIREAIAQDKNPELRCAVVGHPNLSNMCLLMLAQDESSDVKMAVACAPKPILKAAIQRLISSDDPHILDVVAQRTDLPTDILETRAYQHHKRGGH